MKLITLYLPASYIEMVDQMVQEHFYPSRAEAIRSAIRDMLIESNRFQIKTDYNLPSKTEIATADKTAFSRKSALQKTEVKENSS
jgi:Arc/MetJ-type ribon-helix-helix transcriptional regulator